MEDLKTSQDVLYHGFLVKSPPTKRLFSRWRKRWFVLGHNGELPGQYFLKYYVEKECKKLKGHIDLDQCEKIEAGLKYTNRKQKCQYMFSVITTERTYYLLAESETDMNRWVDAVRQVCELIVFPQGPTGSDLPPEKITIKSTPCASPSTIHKHDDDNNDDDDDLVYKSDEEEKDLQRDKADELFYVDIHRIAKSFDKSTPGLKYLEVVFDESDSCSTTELSPAKLPPSPTSYTEIDALKTIALEKAKQQAQQRKHQS